MSEAIKGQDKLKLAVEKLEIELFKDWPGKSTVNNAIGIMMDYCGDEPFMIKNCRFFNDGGIGVLVDDSYITFNSTAPSGAQGDL